MRTWTFHLPMTTPPLSMNDRMHWRVKAKKVRELRNLADWAVQIKRIPELAHFTVELHYAPRDKRRRDPENYFATVKALVDGLIDGGVAPDDNPTYYTSSTPIIDPPTGAKEGSVYVIVREMEKP